MTTGSPIVSGARHSLRPSTAALRWHGYARALRHSLRDRADWQRLRIVRLALFLIRLPIAPHAQLAWLRLIDQTRLLRSAAQRDGQLWERAQHPWVCRTWSLRRRLEGLTDHYRWQEERMGHLDLAPIYADRSLCLARAPLKDGSQVEVHLAAPVRTGHEGELNLVLRWTGMGEVFAMTVTFAPTQRALLIGCLQGPRPVIGRDRIRHFTRASDGLRPRDLMISLAYAVAQALDLPRVRGIAAQAHVLQRRGRIHANYDQGWRDAGGLPAPDGFFDLPLHPPRRTIADVPSKRRAAVGRREALRVTLTRQVTHALRHGAPLDASHARQVRSSH